MSLRSSIRDVERLRFKTESGSTYEITRSGADMSWRRLATTLASGQLRSEGGVLLEWPDVAVGARCQLVSEPTRRWHAW